MQVHELPVGLSSARACACWCCWRVRRWLRRDRDERDDECGAPCLPLTGSGRAQPADSLADSRPVCPEFVMRRSDGVISPWHAPPRILGLPVACLEAVKNELEGILARVAHRHADSEVPEWAGWEDDGECSHA